jgi:hypothetical protein
MTSMTSIELVPVDDIFSRGEWLVLLGFLAAYQRATGEAYAADLRQFSTWCTQHRLGLFEAHRVDFECFARNLEVRGGARARGPAAVHDHRVLPLRRGGGPH